MRCLYCGKELALLKRLRGGGEFCSDAHKQSYQEEYNRLGLSRLLQARSRADESKGAQKPPAAPVGPVAVAEQLVEETIAEIEETAVQVEEVVIEAAPPPPIAPAVIAAPPEPPPPAMAGFAMETPSLSAPPEPVPYLEPWRFDEPTAPTSPPPAPAWHLEGPYVERQFFTLPSAEMVPLEMQPGVCESSYPVMDTSVTPLESGAPGVHLSMPLAVTSSHEFERGGSIAIEILPRPSESSCYASLNGAVDFSYPVGVQVFDLLDLDLSPAGIAYPAEECDVTVPESWTNGIISDGPIDIIVPAIPRDPPAPELPVEPATVPPPVATPRTALEALSKLHQDMRQREEAKPAAPPAEAPLPATGAAPLTPQETLPAPPEPSPLAAELVAIPVKSFAPPKAGPVIDVSALLTNGHPLLPRLKALPLRPKVAPAPRGFSQQPKTAPAQTARPQTTLVQTTAAQTAAKSPQGSTPPVAAPPKPPAVDKPAQPPQTSKSTPAGEKPKTPQPQQAQPPQVKKPAQPAEPAPAKESAPATPAQAVQQPKETAKPAKPEQITKPVPVKTAPSAPTPQPSQTPKSQPAAATLASPPAKSEPVQKAPAAKNEPAEKPKATSAGSGLAASADHTVPNFGAVVNTSIFGSLKLKLGIAALIAVASIGVYFQVTGKARASASQAKTSDVGMSIMVGEGGWVENWAGDPIGQHGGREITIYRPSLKLSDYRFEFQGQIDTKSIGWIFRAADPDNYYAMKLQLVSPELPLTVVLYKYMVLKGRQVQVGRVPIDVPVKNDTVFSIRVDVRGPKFNTYVQGQPVDVWTDDQLRSGGVGFLNERSERGKVKSVSLSYLSGGTK
jgi:hypothetical protein